ncbi:MAG: HEAT repeat domain-containing protein, partial [Phycisphaerae bacterium]|nr:HEAT repeat domain-containing protein [Phycisphaerae bacterium]
EETTRLSRSWPIAMIFLAGVLLASCLFVNVKAEPPVQADEGKRLAANEPVALSVEDLKRLWENLAGDDVANAWRAVRKMATGGDRAVEFLKTHLELPKASPGHIGQLIANLDSKKYAVREKATKQLALLGPLAEPALRKALAAKPSPEAQARIKALLKMSSGTFISRAVLRVVRAISVLEQIDTPTARKFLRELKASEIVPHVRYYQVKGHTLLAGFVSDKVRCILGEPVFVTFFVRNLSDKPYVFFVGGASRGSVRDNNFRITAVDGAGKPVKDPHSYRHFGGRGGDVKLKPSQVHTDRLYLGHWCAFDRPGEYKVTCKRILNKHRTNQATVAIEANFTLKVLPANTKQMREVIAELGRKLRRGDKQNLYEATLALAAIHNEQVVPHLAASLKRTGWRHKGVAVQALSRFSTDSAAEALCVALKDPDHHLGAAAGKALKQMNKTDFAVDRLLVEFKKGTGADRAAIARALGWTRARRTTKTLVAALADKDAAVRAAAAEAIGALGDWGQIKTLKACLKDKDMGLRVAAVKGLRALEQPIQVEWLTSVIRSAANLNDQSFHEAIRLIRMYGKDRAAPALVSCLKFEDPSPRNSYNMFLILAIEHSPGGPKYYYKYHSNPDANVNLQHLEENRQILVALKAWLTEQKKARTPELSAKVKQALAEAMRIRIKHHNTGLAMWQQLSGLVKPGWTVQQMKMILISPGGGGMMHSKGRVTVSYGVQRGAFMVIAKGKYVVGASYEKRDGDDKIVLTATPTVKEIRPNTRPVTKPSGGREAKAPRDAAKLLKAFSSAKYAWMQAGPAQELIKLGDKSVIPAMLKMLKSENRSRRCNAGWVLAGLGDERGLAAVISELKDTSKRPTKRIRSDGKPDVAGQIRQDRYYAAHVLGKIGDRRAVPDLIDTLKDESIAYQAAIILRNLGDPRALPALKEALKHGNADLRAFAAEAIRRIEKARKPPPATKPAKESAQALKERIAKLITQLASKNYKDREKAQQSLVRIGIPAIPALQAATADKEPERANRAKLALKEIEKRAKAMRMQFLAKAANLLTEAVGGKGRMKWRVSKRERALGLGPELYTVFSSWHGNAVPYFVLPFKLNDHGREKLKVFRKHCNFALMILGSNDQCTVLAGPSYEPDVSAAIIQVLGLTESKEGKAERLMSARSYWLDFRLAVARPSGRKGQVPQPLTNGPTIPQIEDYKKLFAAKGPNGGRHRGDPFLWFGHTKFCEFSPLLVTTTDQQGVRYLLLSDKPEHVMLSCSAYPRPWYLKKVYATKDARGRPAVGLEFDETASKRLSKLTSANIGRPLAVLFH